VHEQFEPEQFAHELFCMEVYERRERWRKRRKLVLMSAAGRNGK